MTEKQKNIVDEDGSAARIARLFGNAFRLAKAIGRSSGTVHRWLVNGFIPHEYHAEVWQAAKREGVTLAPIDFVNMRDFA